jgi:hypothetical protein
MAVVVLNLSLAVFAVLAALRFGSIPEKRASVIIIIMLMMDFVGHYIYQGRYFSVDPLSFIVDMIGLVGFGWIGINSKRIWPLWAASLQLLSVGAHFVRALELPVRPIVYAWMKSGPTWGVILLLIVATVTHCWRKPPSVSEPSWPG